MPSEKLVHVKEYNPIKRYYKRFTYYVEDNFHWHYRRLAYSEVDKWRWYKVILLINSTSDASPLMNMLRDILNDIKLKNTIKDEIVESGVKRNKTKLFSISKAYIYWVNQTQSSFEWVKGVMNELVENDSSGVIDLHNCCTTIHEEDASSAVIIMLQSLYHAKNGVDIVSGTKVKTQFTRPNWHDVLMRLAINHSHERIGKYLVPNLIDFLNASNTHTHTHTHKSLVYSNTLEK